MLREYQLTNFKAFAGPETIPIRPITLIYGPNSSGKSSLLQSLLLLKQTLQEAENPETLLLPKGNLVNLGGYREFVHRHDVRKPFSFKVLLDVDKAGTPNPFWNLVPEQLNLTSLLGLHVAFIYDEQTSNVVFSSIELFIGDDSSPVAIYKPEKRDVLGVKSSGSPETILKLDHINYAHRLWQAWWEKFGCQLPENAHDVVEEIFKALEFNKGRKGWQKKILTELQAQSKSIKEKLKKLDEQNKQDKLNLEQQVLQIESLIRFDQHFKNFTFEKAIEDLSKSSQDSVLSCRNFLPMNSIATGAKESSFARGWSLLRADYPNSLPIKSIAIGGRNLSGSEIWELSRMIYKQRWQPNYSDITLLVCSTFKRFLESVIYIGPLRDSPERLYILSGNSRQEVGKSGKMVSDILFRNPELLEQVNEQLERFGLGYELKVALYTNYETSELSDVFALRLVDKYTGVNVSLLDVGFGISQVLPIVVQSMLSRNSTLLIEQPEIHIHPRLQAELGSLLAECIKPPFENQFIIETHSEHLMLRLQKLIRKGELKPEDISVIYVDRGTEGSKCFHLRLDEEGDFIDEWPDGFFEEDFNEIFQ
jgi:hypothetical protein